MHLKNANDFEMSLKMFEIFQIFAQQGGNMRDSLFLGFAYCLWLGVLFFWTNERRPLLWN